MFSVKNVHTAPLIHHNTTSSPVPELMSSEECPRLDGIQFENDFQHIKSQKAPLSIRYHRVLFIQTNEHSIHQDNQIIGIYKHSETNTKCKQMILWNACMKHLHDVIKCNKECKQTCCPEIVHDSVSMQLVPVMHHLPDESAG